MSAGLIDNWMDVEDLWEYLLYENLGIEEGSHPILVTEVAENHKKNREKIGEVSAVVYALLDDSVYLAQATC